MFRNALGLVFLLAALLSACSDDDTPTPAATSTATAASQSAAATPTLAPLVYPATIGLPDGGSFTIDAAPQRIISLSPHATEILCAIGAGDQLVAVDSYANCPEGSNAKPELDSFQPNLEAIAAFEPDLVITTYDPSGLVESLERLDIPVLFLDLPGDVGGVTQHVYLFGYVTDHREEAQALLTSIEDGIAEIETALADVDQGPRVFHELDTTYYTVAPGSFIGDLYTLLKAQNIADGAGQAYPQLSAEVILERDPQVIILADEAAGVDAAAVKARPGWDVIDAVQNDRICIVDPDLVSRPGSHLIEALRELAACLYPDKF